jgi:hypothetical protein
MPRRGVKMELVLTVLFLLQLKHFICDFPLQSFPYMYENKGTYGHPGGLLHSAVHFVGSLIALVPTLGFSFFLAGVVLAEFVAHYHIDWWKMRTNKKTGWGPHTSEYFWWLLGFDQLLHQLCYIGMICILLS